MDKRWKEPLAILSIVLIILTVGILYFAALPYLSKASTELTRKTTSTGSTMELTTTDFQNLSITLVTPDLNNASAWIPLVVGGQFTRYAKLARGQPTLFVFNITNVGESELHLWGVSYQFSYPNGQNSGQFSGSVPYRLLPGQTTKFYVAYGTNLPSFSGGFGKLVLVVYGADNAWTKSFTVPLAY